MADSISDWDRRAQALVAAAGALAQADRHEQAAAVAARAETVARSITNSYRQPEALAVVAGALARAGAAPAGCRGGPLHRQPL